MRSPSSGVCEIGVGGDTDAGAAFLYQGSPTGLSQGGTRPSGRPSNANWSATGGQANASFGHSASTSVATAGDVNGDGYSDLLAGAYRFDAGETDEGRGSRTAS